MTTPNSFKEYSPFGRLQNKASNFNFVLFNKTSMSNMKKLVVFFYIDALNSSFLNSDLMPFLSNLAAKHHYWELENVFGYSFAIQSCMLSGKYPQETNHWLPYFYAPQKSPMIFKTLNRIGTVIPFDKLPILRHLTVGRARSFILEEGVRINNVPFRIIDKLALYPYYYMCDLPFFTELKELLEKKCDMPLTYIGPPNVRKDFHESLLKHIKASNNEKEFIVVYNDALDGLGHKFGPYSTECITYVKSLDRALRGIYKKLKECFGKNLTFLVFSDHGQCEQVRRINILAELERFGLGLGDDYLCFIDATLALFWPQNETTKEKILNVLNKIEHGKIIDDDQQKYYHIKFNDNRFGEIIFTLNPGGTFFPNFFSPFGAMKGLHGYLPEEDVQKSFLISNMKLRYNLTHIKDLRNLFFNICSNDC
ncbi:MAG: alkaline phosphatase family protein [Asgard group archaeon]|nr:alkaline phosphatase family protein [Asgard group archaeon]